MSLRPTLILPVHPDGTILVRLISGGTEAFAANTLEKQIHDIVIPGQMARLYSHELPKMREREKQAAARFTIEDRTAASLEGQHIAIGNGADNRLAVTDRAELSTLISTLELKGIDVGDIYVDFDWITPQADPIVLADRIIFTGAYGYTIDPEWADSDLANVVQTDWNNLTARGGALSLRQGALARKTALNLPFASLTKIAALVLITGISWLTLQWTETRAIKKEAANLKVETAKLYTQFTGQAAPSNPALAVTRAIKNGSQNGLSIMPLMAGFNSVLMQTENISVQLVSYEEGQPQLTLRLIYPSFESAGELEAAASRTGGVFRAGGVREQNGILIGDATFEMGNPS